MKMQHSPQGLLQQSVSCSLAHGTPDSTRSHPVARVPGQAVTHCSKLEPFDLLELSLCIS